MIPLAGGFLTYLNKNKDTNNKAIDIVNSLNIYKQIIILILNDKYPSNDKKFFKIHYRI